jgi:sodium transport system permease protein
MAFIMLIPVSLTITALFLAIAVFAKDFKDGQNFLTPVIVILMLPLSTTLIPGIELNAWTAFVPVVNIALLIKALFLAEAKTDLLFLTLASSSAYGTLALLFAARVFEREQVLLGGKESLGQILKFERKKDSSPSPAMALTTFCLVFVLIFYGSLLLKNATLITALLTTEYLFFLLPALSLSWLAGHSFRNTYHMAWPDWRGILGSLLIGCSAWAGIGGLATRLFPPPESLVRSLSKLVQLGDQPQPLWVLWLVIGLTPALCEEFFFRGLVLSGLKRWGMVGAVCTSGLLFGLAHSSIYRLLPTLVLGLLLGYAVWRTRSIVTSILIHVLNNGLVATLVALSGFQPGSLDWKNMKFLPWSWTLAGLAVTLAGVVLLRLAPSSEEKASNRTHP